MDRVLKWVASRLKGPWLLALLLVVAVGLAYQPVWHAGFMWDDDSHLTENPCIVGPLGFHGIWATSAATYYPLVLTSFWVQHAIWGLSPGPYHLVNVLVHAADVVLLALLLVRLRVPGAWLAAALWALHPVNVESVAWVTELKNTQSCFFYLLSIWFFLKWRESRMRSSYAWAFLYAVAAILSKSSTVMLPVVLGLCGWWLEGRWRWRNVFALIPFFAISLAASGWTIWEQQFHSGALGVEWSQTGPQRLIIAGRALWFYLGKLAWPHPLIFIYPRWEVDASQALAWLPVLAAAGWLCFCLWQLYSRRRALFFASAYFVVSLFPVLGFFSVYFFRYSFVGDHFQYLASMGPLTLVAAGLTLGLRQHPRLLRLLGGGLLLVLAVLTWRQTWVYQSSETLWADTLARNPSCWLGHNNLGMEYLQSGRVDQATVSFKKAIELNREYADGENNLGLALVKSGKLDDAIGHWQKAIEFKSDNAFAYNNLAIGLYQTGRRDEALARWRKAIEINPDYAEARNNLQAVLNEAHQPPSADDAKSHYDLGMALMAKGRARDAIVQWRKVRELAPSNPSAFNQLAWVLATSPDASIRNGPEALELATQAVKLSGGSDPALLDTLAAAQAECGKFDDALETVRRALDLARGDAALAADLKTRLALYAAQSPYREPLPDHP